MMKKKLIIITSLNLVVLTLLISVFCICQDTYADNITMTIDTNIVSLNLAPTNITGEFAQSSDANISVSTTSSIGYILSIASSTGSTDLKNGVNTISSISNSIDEQTFSNATNTYLNNKWGYKPSTIYNTSTESTIQNSNFFPLPGQDGSIIAKTTCANNTSQCTQATDTYTLAIGARVNSTTPIGSYKSDPFIITAVANIITCDSTKLCIEYDGNGLDFDGSPINIVNHNSTYIPMTKSAHSSNFVDDDDTPTSHSYEDWNSVTPTTIPYANTIDINLKYSLDNDASLVIAKGFYTDDEIYSSDLAFIAKEECNSDDYQCIEDIYYEQYGVELDILGVYTGSPSGSFTEPRTVTLNDIDSSTITFAFYGYCDEGDGCSAYGYYAETSGMTRSRIITSGEYIEPTGVNSLFHGWSTTRTTSGGGLPSQVEYIDGPEASNEIPGNNGDTSTLYAVWQQGYPVTFTKDSNVTSIAVLNEEGNNVGTITENGQSLILYQGSTYKFKPTFVTNYLLNTATKTTGAGELNDSLFTVGAGNATINISSREAISFDQAFATAGKTKYNGYYKIQDATPAICSNVDIINPIKVSQVIDVRDDEVYYIGKLADGRCWMLDNLRLDLTNSEVLNGLNTNNTNVDTTSLTSLRSGNRSAGIKYATTGFSGSNWTSGYSYSEPMIKISGTDSEGISYNKNSVATNSYGVASGKIGVYYNYCAASAGSFCYGDGTTAYKGRIYTTSTQYDLCPAGWRMPTGDYNEEYDNLRNYYSSNNATSPDSVQYNLSLSFAGNTYSGSNGGTKSNVGYYWSSTVGSLTNNVLIVSNFEAYKNTVNYMKSGQYFMGKSMRCILKN